MTFLEMVQTYWLYFLVGQYPEGPLGGLVLTLLLASAGLVLAMPVGLALGLARVSPMRWLRWPVTALVYCVRGVPLLMVIFWAYFFLPSVTGVKTGQFSTMLLALVLFDGVYLAEIVRAGIQAIPTGQLQAAQALGMSRWQSMRYVVLPQAVSISMPAFMANIIFLLKETSVFSAISLMDLMFTAKDLIGLYYKTAENLFLLVVFYLIILLPVSLLGSWLERRLRYAGFGS